jgi:hypothetical protein
LGTILESAGITLIEIGQHALTDQYGHNRFNGLEKGSYKVNAVKSGCATLAQVTIQVSGDSSTSFDIELSAI